MYVCSSRRRNRPGTCSSRVALPIAEADEAVLSVLDDELFAPGLVDRLLDMIDAAPVNESERLRSDLERLRKEERNLMESVARGVPAESVAPLARERRREIEEVEAKIDELERLPRLVPVDKDKLRAALGRITARRRDALRGEPKLPRRLLAEFVGPLEIHPEPPPQWMVDRYGEDARTGMWWTADLRPVGLLLAGGDDDDDDVGYSAIESLKR